jgi:hydroxypyruvate isomerase
MPRFAANLTMMFNEVGFLDRFDLAAAQGFRAVECVFPYEHDPAELRRRLAANGLQLLLFNTPAGNWAGGERGLACLPGRQAEFRDAIKRALDYATALDCGLVHAMAGIPPADLPHDHVASLFAANLAWAGEQALAAGVMLVLEPINHRDMPGYFMHTTDQAAAVIQALGSDRLGMQFDLYHCQITEGDLISRLARHLPLVRHMQLADVPGRNEPGTGEIGWDFVLRRIDELGYPGWIGCEYRPAGETIAGLSWMKRYGS